MADIPDKDEANKALWIAGGIIVVFLFALFTNGFGLFGGDDDEPPQNNKGVFVKLDIGRAPTLGSADAPVTVFEFSDFSCPICAVAAGLADAGREGYTAPLPALKKKYVDTGKVRLVFKYFPGHGTGTAGHLVGWCLNEQEQGLFWKFHDEAFKQQSRVASLNAMKGIAETLGADTTALEQCLKEQKYNALLSEDKAMGLSNGVQGTPTFFVNGKMFSGAQDFALIEDAVEKALAKEK
jgi:protein-disulfide isomerase